MDGRERKAKYHELKCWPEPFQAVGDGRKTCEYRLDDGRDFQVHDVICLREWEPGGGAYTGSEITREITHITRGPSFGVPSGYVIISLER